MRSQLVAIKPGLAVLLTPTLERSAGNLFSISELCLVLAGAREITDKLVQDWELHTRYEGGLHADSQLVRWF